MTITPATGQTGTSTITLTVSDGSLTTSDTFLLTVNAVTVEPPISTWRELYFSNPANSGHGADNNDFDFDGQVNLLEYALGSLPNDSSSANTPAPAVEVVSDQSYLTLTIAKTRGSHGCLLYGSGFRDARRLDQRNGTDYCYHGYRDHAES